MRKSSKIADEVSTKFEKRVIENGETLTSLSFALGRSLRSGSLSHFYTKGSGISDCSYNTIMSICDYLGCSPDDLMEENEINGVYRETKAISNIVDNIKQVCHKTVSKNGTIEYFQSFLRRSDLSFTWITEFPTGRVDFRCGRFQVKNNTIIEGDCFESSYNSDTTDLSKLYVTHKGVIALTPVLFSESKKEGIPPYCLDPCPNFEEDNLRDTPVVAEDGTVISDTPIGSTPGLSETDTKVTQSHSFIFSEIREGRVVSNTAPVLMKRKGLFAALEPLKLQVLPYNDLSGRFLSFLKDLYKDTSVFEDINHSEFMRKINPVLSPFKNKAMRKELKELECR